MPLLETPLAMTGRLVLVMRRRDQEVPGGLNLGVHCSERTWSVESTRGVSCPTTVATCLRLSRQSSHAPFYGNQTVSSHCCLVSVSGLSDHRLFHRRSTRHLQRLSRIFVSVARAAHQRPLFSLPGLAIERPSLCLPVWKAASVVRLPGQRVIARMLTRWGAAPCLNNLLDKGPSVFTMCLRRGTSTYCLPIPGTGYWVLPILSLPSKGSGVPRWLEEVLVLASFL